MSEKSKRFKELARRTSGAGNVFQTEGERKTVTNLITVNKSNAKESFEKTKQNRTKNPERQRGVRFDCCLKLRVHSLEGSVLTRG